MSISPKGNAEIRWLATAMGSLVDQEGTQMDASERYVS